LLDISHTKMFSLMYHKIQSNYLNKINLKLTKENIQATQYADSQAYFST